jgi:hypothetical protein
LTRKNNNFIIINVKNLRDELLERLERVRGEHGQLTQRLNRLIELEQAIDLLIREEDLRIQTTQLSLLPVKAVNGRKVIGRTELSRFIVRALADGKSRSLNELVDMAKNENISFDNKSPKRVLHFALVGLKRNNYARTPSKSVWQLTEKAIIKPTTIESEEGKATTMAGR